MCDTQHGSNDGFYPENNRTERREWKDGISSGRYAIYSLSVSPFQILGATPSLTWLVGFDFCLFGHPEEADSYLAGIGASLST